MDRVWMNGATNHMPSVQDLFIEIDYIVKDKVVLTN